MTSVAGADSSGPGAGSPGRGGGSSARARVRLVERLRARRAEIDQAIFARISDQWFDRAGSEDPEYVAGLRAAGVAALDYALEGIECSGESLQPVPAAVLAQARRAARVGVGLDTVLRRYMAGYGLLEGFVIQEAEHDELLRPGSALRDVMRIASALVDRLIAAVSRAYGEEIERVGQTPLASEDSTAPRQRGRKARSERTGSGGSQASPARAAGTRRERTSRRDQTSRCDPTGDQTSRRDRSSRRDQTSRRDRIIEAMVEVAAERGFGHASVKLVTGRAGVSTRTFYEEFDGLRECFLAVLDLGLEHAGELITRAYAREERWQDGVLGALASLLVFLDSEPLLARVWFVEAMAAGSWALERRERIAAALRSMIVGYWAARGEEPLEPVAAVGVMASVLGLIQTHLVTEQSGPLIELLGPLMGFVTSLSLDKEDRAREVRRGAELAREIKAGDPRWSPPVRPPRPSSAPDVALPATLANPGAHRARECLLFLAEQGARGFSPSNREIGIAIGVTDKSQISRLLAYLAGENLVVKRSEGRGKRNASGLTPRGEEIARALER